MNILSNLFASSTQVLENEKESYFTNFQKNNRPSGIPYIQKNSVDYFFEAIKADVLSANESSLVLVKTVEAEVIDVSDKGTTKVASVHYTATISVDDEIEEIDEVWHFQYNGWNWKLAGIEQV